jgi:hypothetical protein
LWAIWNGLLCLIFATRTCCGLAIFCETQTSLLSAIAAQMETATNQYLYRDLKKNEVRLFNISPAGSIDAQIDVHLITVDMLRCPDYEVLSYT